ncbi:hypothetical protein DLAC_01486 [Tieghemostelium lacteum]|uniref:BLOC-1-related complex subunit 7 n=1 Tax=Tieghemostelium lacteum TaxID=361077 RepID=A0A152A5J8_TIELA|nr:hypothetical protein DLAC_01486 [Tieghemostelium lacteum]|eukprot:KYR01499.1 hypothetical protein DLAC_01486 [Tieghemostelium lacteum]
MSNIVMPFVKSQPIDDPSMILKKELTEKGENIVTDMGRAIKALVKHSNVHENIMTIAKTFESHETNVTQTDEMIAQMSLLSKELNQQVKILQTSFQTLDTINKQVIDVNNLPHSYTNIPKINKDNRQ